MCEIFLLKHKKKLIFPKSELTAAYNHNSDGAGFVVFDWDKNLKRWEAIDFETFKPAKGYTYTYEKFYSKYDYDHDDLGCYGGRTAGHREWKATQGYWDTHTVDDDTGEVVDKTDDEVIEEEERAYLEKHYGKDVIDGLQKQMDEADKDREDNEAENRELERAEKHYSKAVVVTGFKAEQPKLLEVKKVEPTKDDVDVIYERQKRLKAGQMMLIHFRLSTSGHTHENTQPILNGDYITIHNGIFAYKSEPVGYSDTRFFSEKLKNASKKISRITPKKEQKLIEKLLKEAGGSYSIFIYSFKTGQIYYYKSNYASFNWAYNGLMGATDKDRFPIRYSSAQPKELITL